MDDNRFVHPIHSIWGPIGLALAYIAGYFFERLPENIILCPSRIIFGLPCPGCGSGEALIAIAKLDFLAAIRANPPLVLFWLALSLWGLAALIGFLVERPLPIWAVSKKRKRLVRWGLIAIVAIAWTYQIAFNR